MLIVVMTMMTLFTLTTHAVSLDYSGGSSSNDTGASATTSGFSVSYSDTIKNVCGYRFSIVTSSGTPKSGTKVVNVYLSDVTEGTSAYSSAHRFIISSGKVANKKQLANGTKVSTTTTVQSCDYKSGDCGFYSTLPQDPSSVGTWIKKSNNSYQNLSRIYVLCGTNLANATESDYVLIEPIFRPSLASKRTAATATELALYGASVSGGDSYNGGNGNLYNAGTGTLWNIMNYVNREFPNALYVPSDTAVYDAVTIKTSGRYTYKQIINNGYGCSVLTVKNVVPINKVKIAYNPNGGTLSSSTYSLNSSGFITNGTTVYFQTINHGNSADPYNASTFGLTRAGYQFGGWKVKSTEKVLDQNTEYASTVYAQHDDKSKTTANTSTVTCYLYAVWTPNKVRIAYNVNGGTLSSDTYSKNSSGFISNGDTVYFHTINHGSKGDPYNASTFGLKRTGYTFAGWKVRSTGTVVDQNTEYSSTTYAQYDDKSKTTSNTTTVTCYLDAQWTPNKVKIKYLVNGGTVSASGYELSSTGVSIFRTSDDTNDWHTFNYGTDEDPYNASTFGLTRTGYEFGGWKVVSTGKVLDQDTEYASTVYAQYDDSSKTSANTATVTCHLEAVWNPHVVKLAYHPNGGTATNATLNDYGFLKYDGETYFQSINHGSKDDPYNASTLGLTRTGYTFAGWEVKSTGTVLDQDTEYASTVYAQHDDKSKTTANTKTVYCYLYAVWEKNTYTNTITHWKYVGTGGDNAAGTYKNMGTTTFTAKYGATATIPTGHVKSYTGFHNTGTAGSYWGTSTWSSKSIGSTFTQPAKNVSIEYYYQPNSVKLAYNVNGGTLSSDTYSKNSNGFISDGSTLYFDYMDYGDSDDPYNATTFGLKRTGYQFAGWKVRSTGKVLDQDTEYASTVYAQYDDSSKTTSNTASVVCYLDAQWTPNKVKLAYNVNGGTISSSTYSKNSNGFISDGSTLYFDTLNYGESDDPYNAATFGLTRTGYEFAGWKVRSTGTILDENTDYASTVYAQYDDKTKTTSNTASVVCYLDAQWTPHVVKIAYHPNGGTTTNSLNANGFIIYNDAVYFQTINYGSSSDPYKAATLSLTRTGYTFKGWKVISTGTVLDQDTSYSSTVYAHYNDSSKTTTNTVTVSCHLYAVWEKNTYTNTIVHWKYVGTGGDNADGTFLKLGTSTFTAQYADTVTIPSNVVKTVTGHYNTGQAGSYWGTSTWSKKNIGSTFTQPAKNVSMEYLYYPKTVNVVFNKNDDSGKTANQSFTYGESGNRFGYNRDGTPKWGNNSGQFGAWDRTGYTLLGWSESPSATTATYSIYSNVSDSWINTKVPDPNASATVNLYAVWKLYAKIVIVPIEPNASYRENTDVISSFWLVNISGDDYTPSTGAKVVFSVYNASGQKIAGETQDFVVPNNDKNLAYFKWRVPNGYGGSNVTIKAYIDDGPYEYNHVERSYRVASFDTLTTPNTSYKDKAPDGFRVPSTTFNNSTNARWWQYSYSGGAFVKKEYAVGNTVSDVTLSTPTNPTAYTSNGKLYMKSGYGFECSYTHSMATISGYQSTSASQSVAPQYFYALFPEYNYTYGANQCRSFEAVSGRKVFVNATGMNRQHFTPIYYPDGEYKFQIVLSDCWTPAGMLTTYKTVTIQIDGNMYDDWYVGRK